MDGEEQNQAAGRKEIAKGLGIEVRADFSQASDPLVFRTEQSEPWQATPYQVADAGHDRDRAVRLVSDWADAQS